MTEIYDEAANSLKLHYDEGQIDFIVASQIHCRFSDFGSANQHFRIRGHVNPHRASGRNCLEEAGLSGFRFQAQGYGGSGRKPYGNSAMHGS
jgi:hypothetical protein